MRSYLPVPSSWYIGLLAVNFGAAGELCSESTLESMLIGTVIMVKTSPLQMPIWALVLAMAIATIFLVP
jgi:hypothetical protein